MISSTNRERNWKNFVCNVVKNFANLQISKLQESLQYKKN